MAAMVLLLIFLPPACKTSSAQFSATHDARQLSLGTIERPWPSRDRTLLRCGGLCLCPKAARYVQTSMHREQRYQTAVSCARSPPSRTDRSTCVSRIEPTLLPARRLPERAIAAQHTSPEAARMDMFHWLSIGVLALSLVTLTVLVFAAT